jgi:hypothetical protein
LFLLCLLVEDTFLKPTLAKTTRDPKQNAGHTSIPNRSLHSHHESGHNSNEASGHDIGIDLSSGAGGWGGGS